MISHNVGHAGEHLAMADLLLKNYIVYEAAPHLPYDIVVDLNHRLLKIQVKTRAEPKKSASTGHRPAYRFNIRCNTEYTPETVDVFALVGVKDGKIGWFNFDEIRPTMIFRTRTYKYKDNRGKYLDQFSFERILPTHTLTL